MRQDCPLSQILFALAIEPLSIMLKTSQHFKGVFRKHIEHRVSLYADDMMLYFSDPVTSTPDILHRFGSFSGYKFNYLKSKKFSN